MKFERDITKRVEMTEIKEKMLVQPQHQTHIALSKVEPGKRFK